MAKAEKSTAKAKNEEATERAFIIKQVFIKHSSLDIKVAPFELDSEWQPDAGMNLDVYSKKLENSHYLVELRTEIDVKNNNKEIFKINTVQSGIFEMAGYTDMQIEQLKNSFCPNILFPYSRQIVSQLTSQAGFPPLIMAPIDFDGRYQQLQSEKS